MSFVSLRSGNLPAVKACPDTPLATYSRLSGLGREGSHHGLLEYCEAKYIAVSW